MKARHFYLICCVLGLILPYSQLVPWLLEHGLNITLFYRELFANRISAFFGIDVFVSAIVVFIFIAFERSRLGSAWWLPAAAVLTVGVSLGLPLLLYLREGGAKPAAAAVSSY